MGSMMMTRSVMTDTVFSSGLNGPDFALKNFGIHQKNIHFNVFVF
jgi:hypothetical protein